jgi:hypothetical protein
VTNTDKLIADYVAGANQLRQAVAGLTPQQLHARPVPGKWSTHEVVCHLADSEIIYADRINRLIAEEDPTVFNADPELFSRHLCYASRDLDTELLVVSTLRLHMAGILRGLRSDQWERTGTHSVDGRITVAELVRRATGHIPHHIRFIAEKRAALDCR